MFVQQPCIRVTVNASHPRFFVPEAANPHVVLHAYIDKQGLKSSKQRDLIVDVFFKEGGHLTVDELLVRVREQDHGVSQATVYRTMRLLVDCGLATARNFQAGQTRYEHQDFPGSHHDHLICQKCGLIIEFIDEQIESLQEAVANRHGYSLLDHKMELYGICSDCQKNR